MAKQDKLDKVLTKLAVMDERDQNTAKDIEAIHATLKVVVEKNQKQDERLNKLDQTMYGENGTNGLKGDMKLVRTRLKWLERASYLGQGAIATFVAFKERIFG